MESQMRFAHLLQILTIFATLLLTACIQPISKDVRKQVDPKTTFAMVSNNPGAFLDQYILLGGVVINLENTAEGSSLEMMEWQLTPWGEPMYLDNTGRRFLLKTSEVLDPTIYEPGVLVTLAGIVLGSETRMLGEHEYDYPVLDMADIHPWKSPFRYGIHNYPDPAYPFYVGQDNDSRRNPYDPGYNSYPYTQYWYRDTGF